VPEHVPDYVVVGHVTQDLLPDGSHRVGGTATYAGLAAARLGQSVGVLTSAVVDPQVFLGQQPIVVQRVLSDRPTVFENVTHGDHRLQYVRGVASRLEPEHLPIGWQRPPIVHLGPVAAEVEPRFIDVVAPQILGVTPQGWLRSWDRSGRVTVCEWPDAERVLARADVAIISEEDLRDDWSRIDAYARMARLLVVTVGARGAIVCSRGKRERVPAYDVVQTDATGAGDVFAAAYMVHLHRTADPIESAQFANCAASFVVEGLGTTSIPGLEQVQERMRAGRLRTVV